ncbi:hypothetical protein LC653_22780 [Nostoc sp. CHAB 5784]|uniref:hypothetical protein n=1 Tax=Nostoc mirabile TaxID=2907820 RepID=UPI001E399149|nr:hypothetical protein [Nostoc mirabile]MCC5666632.1 hypothetical protein [Nostoc mirabile CHAB5784]
MKKAEGREQRADGAADSYFQQITTAKDGTGYYCKSDDVVSFYSPRKYEILRVESGGDIAIVRVRLESSNAGGEPIINNWSFYMKKQKAVFAPLLKEVGEYNYCIRTASDI